MILVWRIARDLPNFPAIWYTKVVCCYINKCQLITFEFVFNLYNTIVFACVTNIYSSVIIHVLIASHIMYPSNNKAIRYRGIQYDINNQCAKGAIICIRE